MEHGTFAHYCGHCFNAFQKVSPAFAFDVIKMQCSTVNNRISIIKYSTTKTQYAMHGSEIYLYSR